MDAVSITALIIMGACAGILMFIGFLVWLMTRQLGH